MSSYNTWIIQSKIVQKGFGLYNPNKGKMEILNSTQEADSVAKKIIFSNIVFLSLYWLY